MARQVRKTVLICCEGKGDMAFLEYLRSVYCAGRENPPKVKVQQAGGRGGNNVIQTLLGAAAIVGYNKLVALIDTNVPPDTEHRDAAAASAVVFVDMSPCLEGFLLKILGKSVPATSAECKQRLRQIDARELFAQGFFTSNFPKALLDEKRKSVAELNELLGVYWD